MKKTLLTLAIAAFTLTVSEAVAQDKTEATKTERSKENIQKEADAIKYRIEVLTEKVEANKDNPNSDYQASVATIDEMKRKWESLTGKKWKEAKK